MIRQYSQQDIQNWADFSGDRNRVHFDKDIAIKNGLQDIIVQGMLILLDAKMMMLPFIKKSSCINFFIKKPVPVNTDIEYEIKNINYKNVLEVSERDAPEVVFVTATILPQSAPVLKDKGNLITVSDEFIQVYINALKQYYPHIKDNWLLMDTLLFCACFNQQKDDYFYRQSLKIAKNHSCDSITTYHVAQKLFVSERLLTWDSSNFSSISYLIEEKDVYRQNDAAYSTFNLYAIEDDIVIFQSSVGCLTKAAPNKLEQ